MMSRRTFVASALSVAALNHSAKSQAQGHKTGKGPEYYELTSYEMRIGKQVQIVGDYLKDGLLPALGRLGIGPIGVFQTSFGPSIPHLWTLVPYPTLIKMEEVRGKLSTELAKSELPAIRAYWDATGENPPFVRKDSTLLRAFPVLPRLEVPPAAAKKEARIFELRTYECPSERGLTKKMEMFTPKMGELDIFRRVGLSPVFFGETLVGSRTPSFTYMLTFPDLAGREKAWAAFKSDPAWLKLRQTPGYADAEIMNNISDLVLAPTAYSQI